MKQPHALIALTAIILFFINSCAPKPTIKVPIEYQSGQKYFHSVCASCHGVDALGKKTRAPGLIDTEYLSENFSDEDFYQQIVDGSKKMPSQRNKVSDSEIKEIIKYLRYSQEIADLSEDDDDPDEDEEE
jgi:mono/diheme cytochrome c family protein